MSGKALIWAANVKGLKPATKIVLIQLAERHNKDTGQCNPSASLMADDCEMDRSTVFRHLAILEESGFLTRHPRGDGDGGRGSNQYELHLDVVCAGGEDARETSQIATRGVGAKIGGKRRTVATGVVANCDTNLQKEPVLNPRAFKILNFKEQRRFMEVSPKTQDVARAKWPKYDITEMQIQWAQHSIRRGGELTDADKAFLGFGEVYVKNNPLHGVPA